MDEDRTDSTLFVTHISKQWLIPLIRLCNDKVFVPDICSVVSCSVPKAFRTDTICPFGIARKQYSGGSVLC